MSAHIIRKRAIRRKTHKLAKGKVKNGSTANIEHIEDEDLDIALTCSSVAIQE